MNHGVKRFVWLSVLVMLVFVVLAVGFRGRAAGTKPTAETQTSGEAEEPAAVGEVSDDETAETEAPAESEKAEASEHTEAPTDPAEIEEGEGVVVTEEENGSVIIEIPGDMGVGGI